MIVPAVALLFVFAYLPMTGILIAFQDYKLKAGVIGFFTSKWVGFDNFWFLQDPYFWTTVKNTLKISVYRMVVTWPVPIILAICLNELRSRAYRRVIQTISYLPYFISWIIAAYMINQVLALDVGIVNMIRKSLGAEQINFMASPAYFSTIVVLSSVWKNAGWSTIIYLAALQNVDPNLQDAAVIDGANRFQRIWHIDLSCIKPTIVILLILSMPGLLSAGLDQILPLQNPAHMAASGGF